MPPLPRATCPTCRREVALRRGGKLREHRPLTTVGDVSSVLCPGSGKVVPSFLAGMKEREQEPERLRGALFDCQMGSLWRRDDGVVVEVSGSMFWNKGRRSGEKVMTCPVKRLDTEPWRRYFVHGPKPGHEQIVYETFMQTHTRLDRDEEAWERDRAVQLELPLRETIVPWISF